MARSQYRLDASDLLPLRDQLNAILERLQNGGLVLRGTKLDAQLTTAPSAAPGAGDPNIVARAIVGVVTIYYWNGAAWVAFGGAGPPGAAGGRGEAGIPGVDGLPGEDSWEPGPPGPIGAVGPTGSTGLTGAAGLLGPPGMDGFDGLDGDVGPPGPTGPAGTTGSAGAPGAAGPVGGVGPPGLDGLDGLDGMDGTPGVQGVTGATGSPGITGSAGLAGPPGWDGVDGEPSWEPGPPGDRGPQGVPGAGGSGASGTTTLDFGAFPGKSDATVTITGQTGILAGSTVDAWLVATATADHAADEHVVETLNVLAGNIVPGTGFTIYGRNTSWLTEPVEPQVHETSIFNSSATAIGVKNAPIGQRTLAGGQGTRIYGLWSVAWQWT